jgi:hypothetical protein
VRLRIVELQSQVEKRIVDDEALTREQHLRNLRVLKEKADAAGNLAVALNAEKLRAR